MVYSWYDVLLRAKTVSQLFCATGHSLDTFPEQMAAVRDAGHEM